MMQEPELIYFGMISYIMIFGIYGRLCWFLLT